MQQFLHFNLETAKLLSINMHIYEKCTHFVYVETGEDDIPSLQVMQLHY